MSRRDHDERTTVLVIGGMHCAACVGRVEGALRGRSGVETAGVNLLTRLATVRHSIDVLPQELLTAVEAIGYQATLASPGPDRHTHVTFGDTIDMIASRRTRFIAGAVFTLLLLAIDRIVAQKDVFKLMLLFLLATPVQLSVGWEYYRGCFAALRRGRFNMDSLVVLGATAAYAQGVLCFIGQVSLDPDLSRWEPLYFAGALILTVMSLGRWLESLARESTAQLWSSLVEMSPREARVVRDGREQTIPAGVVAVGDIVIVRPGEKIPVDGDVIEGNSEVSETLMTGVSRPIPKVTGDRVMVASVNGSGELRIRARGVGNNSTLAQIARRVNEAQERKSRVAQMADRVSGVLVPVALVTSMLAFVAWYYGPVAMQTLTDRNWISPAQVAFLEQSWLSFIFKGSSIASALVPAILVLIVACPCALGLAAPTAILIATKRGAAQGILMKGGPAIEAAAGITDVVFDKTGILTDGSFRLQEVLPALNVDRDEMLVIAGSLGACSEHALARRVVKEAKKNTSMLRKVESVEALPGRGLRGTIGRMRYLMGSRLLMEERRIPIDGEWAEMVAKAEAAGESLVFIAEDGGRPLGALALADRVKESAPQAITDLRELGLKVHLLSGDNVAAARSVGHICGLTDDEIHTTTHPDDKVDFTRQLKEKKLRVAAVGDGVNDAPALAAADVGLAVGTANGVAMESGQIVLTSSDTRDVPRALRLCRTAARTIHWNLWWAFAFNLALVPFAFCNRLTPMLAAIVTVGNSLLVVVNSMRLSYARLGESPSAPAQPSTTPATPSEPAWESGNRPYVP